MKLRLMGTEAECARLTFLLRFGPPDLVVVQVSPPSPNRGDSAQVRVDLEVRFPEGLAPVDRTFYSLILPDGGGLLADITDLRQIARAIVADLQHHLPAQQRPNGS